MKFDFVIGNPPYQIEQKGRMLPVYDVFMNETYKVGSVTELVTPARFLFNAGQTNKDWNKKMLNDEHFKVLDYVSNSRAYFTGVDIKGGVAITIRDENRNYGAIQNFVPSNQMRSVLNKVVKNNSFGSL